MLLINVWTHECIEACDTFPLVGHCVPNVSLVISTFSVSQNYLGFVDPSADTGLARRCTNLTFIERGLTLVHDAFTLVSRHVGLDRTSFFVARPEIRLSASITSCDR